MIATMSTLVVTSRMARQEDASGISSVHAQSWQQTYSGVLPYSALARMIARRGENWWKTAIKRSTLINVMEMDGEIVGYATFGSNRVSTLPFEGEIYEIYMKPEYQGVGLGSRLFRDTRGEISRRAMKGLVLWVLADNESAREFYLYTEGKAIARGHETFDGKRFEKLAYAWD